MQSEFYCDSLLASKRSFNTDKRKLLRRQLRPEYDYPTAIGTVVYWQERKSYKGQRRVYFRCGTISAHTTDTNGTPRYEIDLAWKTENKTGNVKLNTTADKANPLVSELERNKIDREHASFGLIRNFGYSLDQLLETPNQLLPVKK